MADLCGEQWPAQQQPLSYGFPNRPQGLLSYSLSLYVSQILQNELTQISQITQMVCDYDVSQKS